MYVLASPKILERRLHGAQRSPACDAKALQKEMCVSHGMCFPDSTKCHRQVSARFACRRHSGPSRRIGDGFLRKLRPAARRPRLALCCRATQKTGPGKLRNSASKAPSDKWPDARHRVTNGVTPATAMDWAGELAFSRPVNHRGPQTERN